MPIATAVVAARSGTVFLVEERFSDSTRRAGEENYINVLHSDGTLAGYVHLTRNGALVDVRRVRSPGAGDRVERRHGVEHRAASALSRPGL
jgi:hypothetical protein